MVVVVVVGGSCLFSKGSLDCVGIGVGYSIVTGAISELIRDGENIKNRKVKEVVVSNFHRVLLNGFSFDRQ